MVKVRLSKTTPASLDGVHVMDFLKDVEYEVSESLARQFRLMGVLKPKATSVDAYINSDKPSQKSEAASVIDEPDETEATEEVAEEVTEEVTEEAKPAAKRGRKAKA
jgi:hypothetical protein